MVATWNPICTVQSFDAVMRPDAPTVRAGVEHGVEQLGARTLVLCSESSRYPAASDGHARLCGALAACARDPVIARLCATRSVHLEALWFDATGRGIARWDGTAFRALDVNGIRAFLTDVRTRAQHVDDVSAA